MNSPEVKKFIRENSHLFWWIKEESKEDISLNLLVEAILNYGNEKSVKKLFELVGIKKVAEIFYEATNRIRVNYYPDVVNFFNLYFKRNIDKSK
ncbi:MAG: hypothetical protein ISS28_02015 [Candidatus Cloacimonetes bacterium]|nr:hypothetical protein [Candidatus Cloacimonadota bacterium]MBL7085864.1 hypothetical protein [Candidatus Cloacimonadota bacterium]